MHFRKLLYKSPPGLVKCSLIHYGRFFDTATEITNRESFSGLYFCLSDELVYRVKDLRSGTMKGLHYGVVNIPRGSCTLILPKGWHRCFLMKIDLEFYKRVADGFPLLSNFITITEKGLAASVSDSPVLATPEIASIVFKIIGERNQSLGEKLGNMYMESQSAQLILLCLNNIELAFARGHELPSMN